MSGPFGWLPFGKPREAPRSCVVEQTRDALEIFADLATLPSAIWWETLDDILAWPLARPGCYPAEEWSA